MDKNLSSDQNKGNASMIVLRWCSALRVLFGGTNLITQTNGRSPALTQDFDIMGVLLCNKTVTL